MSPEAREILAEALKRSPLERAELIEQILTAPFQPPQGVSQASASEPPAHSSFRLMRSSDDITLQVGATRARHDETCRVGVEP